MELTQKLQLIIQEGTSMQQNLVTFLLGRMMETMLSLEVIMLGSWFQM